MYRKKADGTYLVHMKAKPGRPPKPKHLKMDQKIQVQLTTADYKKLVRVARTSGVRVPEAIRRLVAAGLAAKEPTL